VLVYEQNFLFYQRQKWSKKLELRKELIYSYNLYVKLNLSVTKEIYFEKSAWNLRNFEVSDVICVNIYNSADDVNEMF
jgi:hypothetical protein